MKSSYLIIIFAGIGLLFIFSCLTTDISANDQLIVNRGETLRISARLLMNGTYGDPVPNQIVNFFDETNNRFINSSYTDSNGYAFIDWYLPLEYSLGITFVNATFYGNDTYALTPSYQRLSVIIQASTHLQVQVESVNLVLGNQMVITSLLTDDNKNPLSNASIDLYCNSNFLISEKSNVTGQAKFIINCNQSWGNLGSNNITINYGGNAEEFHASSKKSFLINIEKINTSIQMHRHIPSYFILNNTLHFELTLEANNEPLENATIQVFLDSNNLSNLITNVSGTGMYQLTLDDTFTLGFHTLEFEYSGTEHYDSSFYNVNFVLVSPVIIKSKLQGEYIIGEESIVRIFVVDIFGRPIHNASIILTDSITNQSFIQKIYSNTNFSDFHLQIGEQKGVRDYNIEVVGNEFITNRTSSISLVVWSQPSLSLINSSIMNYASPSQTITLGIRLSCYSSNCPNRTIHLLSKNGLINTNSATNHYGITMINFSSPTQEGEWKLSIFYEKNDIEFELSSDYLYTFFVTRIMPVKVELQYYSVVPSLQQLQLNLKIIAYNGSALNGIRFNYEWLSMSGYVFSIEDGIISLCLSVPSEKGLYSFSYQTVQSSSVQTCSGVIFLSINEQDAAASQGIGIIGIVVCIGISFGIVLIPRIIRKRMFGL